MKCVLILVVTLVGCASHHPTSADGTPADRSTLTSIEVPPTVKAERTERAVTETRKINTKLGKGSVRVTVTPDGKIAAIAVSQNLVQKGVDRNILLKRGTAGTAEEERGHELEECLKRDGCADKPTSAGVAVCVASCVVEVLQDEIEKLGNE